MSSSPVSVTFKPTNIPGVIQWELTNLTGQPILAVLVRGASCPLPNGGSVLIPAYVFGSAYWPNYIRLGVKFQTPPFGPSVKLGVILSPNGIQVGLVWYIPAKSSVAVMEQVFNCQVQDYYAVPVTYLGLQDMLLGYNPRNVVGYPAPGFLPNPKKFSNVPMFTTLQDLPQPPTPISKTDYRFASTTLFAATSLLALGEHQLTKVLPIAIIPP